MSTVSAPDPVSAPAEPRRAYLDLFLISFVILFFELACIRWFGSTVVFLTFFTNIVLMACFLGMSVGCLAASRRSDFIGFVLPLTAFSRCVLAYCDALELLALRPAADRRRRPGLAAADLLRDRVPAPTIPASSSCRSRSSPGVFFVLIALMFVGLGQVMGRAFNAIPNRVARLHDQRRSAAWPGSSPSALLSYARSRRRRSGSRSAAAIVLWFIPAALGRLQMSSALGIAGHPRPIAAGYEGARRRGHDLVALLQGPLRPAVRPDRRRTTSAISR